MPLTAQQASFQLNNNTTEFLRRQSLWLHDDVPASGVTNCRIADAGLNTLRPGSILKTKRMHATQMFEAAPVPFVQGGQAFTAHWIKMHVWNTAQDLIAMAPYTLPLGGPALMLTTQLTGCSFAIQDNGDGTLDVIHIQPNANVDGAALHTALSNGPWTRVYGRNNYVGQGRSVSIVGRRVGGQWRIWAQKQDRFNNYAVLKVKQIYP